MFELSQIFNFDLASLSELSPFALFFIFFFATFVSEDAACLTAGALVAQGRISFALALTACLAGIFVGDILLYWAGRLFGKPILQTKFFSRFVSENSFQKASHWLEKRGATAVFLSRFVTGLRLPTYLAAGFLRTDFLKFTFYFLLAAAVWTPLLVAATAFAGQILFPQNALLLAILIFIGMRIIFKFSSWKKRRVFIGKFKRATNWEFWSWHVFYFPVVLYVLWLGIKHRNLTVFTCTNPAILAGGFVGESKNKIYEGLRKSAAALEFLLPHLYLTTAGPLPAKISQIRQFIDENNLSFPLVLKPDAGERGKGVKIVSHPFELENELKEIRRDYILQEFAEGVEASIFYYRFPNQEKGKIFSITEKRFPVLTGDGKANLETLILRDKRAVCRAKSYFEYNREKLETIPAKGEKIRIIDIGTHSRGAIFLDGEWLKTEKLESKIDEICRGFKGFYFGRFDIRANSFADLRRGENFKIIELNGVTSESTNLYDPKFSLFDAYRILFRQWRTAFSVGAENFKLGVKPTPVLDLIRLIFGKPVKIKESVFSEHQPLITGR